MIDGFENLAANKAHIKLLDHSGGNCGEAVKNSRIPTFFGVRAAEMRKSSSSDGDAYLPSLPSSLLEETILQPTCVFFGELRAQDAGMRADGMEGVILRRRRRRRRQRARCTTFSSTETLNMKECGRRCRWGFPGNGWAPDSAGNSTDWLDAYLTEGYLWAGSSQPSHLRVNRETRRGIFEPGR